jgi:putative peptide zinc metalloprotease protein
MIILFIIALGFVCFILTTGNVLLFFSYQHASLLLVLTLIPLSLFEVMFHELGHAFAVKAFGREVHYIGVGWFWTAPVAFTDTSDMWLAKRRPRMLVNLAGVYVDVLSAGVASLLMFAIPNPYIQGMLWLFALYTYVGAFKMLSPLQELDGYYVLMDWVEKNRLRQSAVVWLVKIFPKSIRNPKLFREHKAEVIYWVSCLIYLILVSILTMVVVGFIAQIMGTKPHPLISLCLPLIVVVISSLGIIADIRNKAEE